MEENLVFWDKKELVYCCQECASRAEEGVLEARTIDALKDEGQPIQCYFCRKYLWRGDEGFERPLAFRPLKDDERLALVMEVKVLLRILASLPKGSSHIMLVIGRLMEYVSRLAIDAAARPLDEREIPDECGVGLLPLAALVHQIYAIDKGDWVEHLFDEEVCSLCDMRPACPAGQRVENDALEGLAKVLNDLFGDSATLA